MPHSTTSSASIRAPSLNRTASLKSALHDHGPGADHPSAAAQMLEKFPEYPDGLLNPSTADARHSSPSRANGYANGAASAERWQPRRSSRGVTWSQQNQPKGHRRGSSITDAVRNFRNRHGSISQNAHEIADALKAPVSPRLVVCLYHRDRAC